jgi:hypothetical protein
LLAQLKTVLIKEAIKLAAFRLVGASAFVGLITGLKWPETKNFRTDTMGYSSKSLIQYFVIFFGGYLKGSKNSKSNSLVLKHIKDSYIANIFYIEIYTV